MRSSIFRSGLAITAAAAVVTLMAGPAGAVSTAGEVTAGTITSNITSPPTVVSLGAGPSCMGDPTTTITVDVTGSAPNYSSSVTGATFPRGFFDIGTNHYRIELGYDSGGTNSGVITTGGAVAQNIGLTGTITQVTTSGQCTGGTQVCDLGPVQLTVSGTHDFSGFQPLDGTATVSGSATFNGIGVCSSPFSALEDFGASVSDLTVVFPA